MLKSYFQIALKVYARRKLFTVINLLCIVLTLSILLVACAVLQHLFFPTGVEGRSDRFLQVNSFAAISPNASNIKYTFMGYRVIDQYLKGLPSAELVSAVTKPEAGAVYQHDRVTKVRYRYSDAEYWSILDFQVVAGHVYSVNDVEKGRALAVINVSTAKKVFHDDVVAHAVGQTINLNGIPYQVIGVVNDELHINAYSDIWIPHTAKGDSNYRNQFFGNFTALIMAKSSKDIPALKREVLQAAKRVRFDDPNQWKTAVFSADSKLDMFARLFDENPRRSESGIIQIDPEDSDARPAVLVTLLVGLMVFFMVLPALNLINLNVGRMQERCAEIGVRKAFGASSRILVGQFVFENILICLVGGLVSLAVAELILLSVSASGIVPYMKISVNLVIWGYAFVLATLFGLMSGAVPAWKMARIDPVFALKGIA